MSPVRRRTANRITIFLRWRIPWLSKIHNSLFNSCLCVSSRRMVSGSPSILSFTASFSSNSKTYSDSSSTSSPLKFGPLNFSRRSLSYPNSFKSAPLKVLASSSVHSLEDGSAEQFLKNNSIADFMRFKRGVDGDSGKLQSAVVSYRKKFPWSILRPFLKVSPLNLV